MELNVLKTKLKSCCSNPMTGFFRDGYCRTDALDSGTHVVCAVMTQEFLDFTKSKGNDLTTPIPHWSFSGLKVGSKWCLCVSRWKQAEKAGFAPKVVLESTSIKALDYVSLDLLKSYRLS